MPARKRTQKPPIEWYPLRFKEIYRKKLWGGNQLRRIMKKSCPPKTGESWELSHWGKDVSVVAEGPMRGWSLDKILERDRPGLMGREHYMRFYGRFPLLIKFISPDERLSLQVHPPDEYAQRYEASGVGKVEAWLVVDAPETSRVVRGVLPGTTVTEFRRHLTEGTVEQCLNVMEVEEGDVVFLPPGTLHSAHGGPVFLEVQQTSDTTYRLTDWGRRDLNGKARTLDVEKAMQVIDFHSMGVSKHRPARIPGFSYKRKLLIKCEKFTMEMIEAEGRRIQLPGDTDRFHILTVIRGKGDFRFGPKKKKRVKFGVGQTFLIPSAMGEYDIVAGGKAVLVDTYIE